MTHICLFGTSQKQAKNIKIIVSIEQIMLFFGLFVFFLIVVHIVQIFKQN